MRTSNTNNLYRLEKKVSKTRGQKKRAEKVSKKKENKLAETTRKKMDNGSNRENNENQPDADNDNDCSTNASSKQTI